MARPFKPNPIAVDYQRGVHEYAEKKRAMARDDDGRSGLFYLSVWALSTGLFLTAFYVACEAPFQGVTAYRAPVVQKMRGLAMSAGRSASFSIGGALGARNGAAGAARR